jgi:hypothetical protein
MRGLLWALPMTERFCLLLPEGMRAETLTLQEIITLLKEQGYPSDKISALTIKEVRAILKKRSSFERVFLKRLTALMQELGAKDAIALDGGTSSGLYLSSPCSPSNNDPLIADALVVDKNTDHIASQLISSHSINFKGNENLGMVLQNSICNYR